MGPRVIAFPFVAILVAHLAAQSPTSSTAPMPSFTSRLFLARRTESSQPSGSLVR
jgi:hypothetical protein